MSDAILSVAAFASPYSTLPPYFWAAHDETCTIRPPCAGTIRRAACWLATRAARTPDVTMASHRQVGCSQNGAAHVNRPSSTIRDRKSTRLNSRHQIISYAVFCLLKNNTYKTIH